MRTQHANERSAVWQTSDQIEDHVALMRRQVETSLKDPASRMLAAALVSGNFDQQPDPRTGQNVPVVPFHGRFYRAAVSWAEAKKLCRMRDYRCEVTALWNFLVLNVRYTSDQDGEDTYQTLRATLEAGAGDCDDMTIALAVLLKSVGFSEVVARIISLDGRSWAHVYPLVHIPRVGWVALDATEMGKPMGWEFKGAAAQRDFAL